MPSREVTIVNKLGLQTAAWPLAPDLSTHLLNRLQPTARGFTPRRHPTGSGGGRHLLHEQLRQRIQHQVSQLLRLLAKLTSSPTGTQNVDLDVGRHSPL